MARAVDPPTYPVIEDDPSFSQIMSCTRRSELMKLGVITVLSLPLGYAVGRPVLMRPSMYMSGTLSAMFSGFFVFNKGLARLTGYDENAEEVAKYSSKASAVSSAATQTTS